MMTVREATRRFLRHLEANDCSRHTVRSYCCDLEKLCGFLGDRKSVKAIIAHDLTRFLTSDDARLTSTGRPKGPGARDRADAPVRAILRVSTGAAARAVTGATLRRPW